MRRLRELTSKFGHETSGSDVASGGHDQKNVYGAELVVFSSAVNLDNEELVYAREKSLPVVSRAQYLAKISERFNSTVAVSGTHGKTTATAMTATAMRSLRPTLHVGANFSLDKNEREDVFITEACEYRRNFLFLCPDVAVILNCEWEHTDCYRDEEEVKSAFLEFAKRSKKVVVNGDEENLKNIRGENVITFGKGEGNDIWASQVRKNARGGYDFTVTAYGLILGGISLSVLGEHNVYNALSAVAVALDYGISFAQIKQELEQFKGVGRRLERVGVKRGVEVYCDYAHHPTEIRACVRSLKGEKRLIVVYEAHTYSRTYDLFDKFTRCFEGADEVIFAPVFGAREKGDDAVINKLMRGVSVKTPAKYFSSYDKIKEYLVSSLKVGERVVFVGAGNIDRLCKAFVSEV